MQFGIALTTSNHDSLQEIIKIVSHNQDNICFINNLKFNRTATPNIVRKKMF